jgi:hypothetical protein
LCADGKKVSPKYTTKEFEEVFNEAKSFMARIKCSPIELEKAAFVLIKESEPVYEPKPKKEPSGLPRGRPPKPDSEKKPKKPTVPGRGRGRPPKATTSAAASNTETAKAPAASGDEKPRGRGRPPKQKLEATPEENDDMPAAKTPPSNKRKAPAETPPSAKRSAKKART